MKDFLSCIARKKSRLLLISTWLFTACASTLSYAEDSSTKTCDSLTATGNPEYPPFLWKYSDSNDLHGAISLLMAQLSKKIEIPIQVTYVGPWSRSQQEVRSGRVDLMAGAFYTSERSEYMDYFSPAMMFTKSVVWQSEYAKFDYQSWGDLEGRWGATLINNSFGQDFDDFAKKNLNLLTVASLEQAFSMLDAGRADYVLYEVSPGLAYIQRMGLENRIVAVEPSISSEGLFLTMSRQSPCNTPEIKQKIAMALRDLVEQNVPQDVLLSALSEWSKISGATLEQ